MVEITQIVKLVQMSQNDKPVQMSDIDKLLTSEINVKNQSK